ncbi:MAG: CoA transferase, partial [Chloroflexi bacterium]|nr:CoA transferase [Chloroflexota bacterium]
MTNALENIRVLEMTEAMAGPYCAMLLGDFGADVIKIERPQIGDQARAWGPPFVQGESAYFLSVNRNKRSVTLDIKTDAGLRVLHQLISTSDIFITNIPRLDSLRRARIDYDSLRAINPRLIYVAISGYGHTGPKAGRGGYDVVAQGEAGLMAITGSASDGPIRFPAPMADISAGVYATIGILAALYAREKNGRGQFIDVALVDAQATWLANIGGSFFATGARAKK